MSIQAGVGISKLTNSREAGKEASTKASENLKGKKGDMIFVFASSSFDQDEVLKGVSEIYAGAKIIGCSTAGEITNQGAYTNSAVVLAINSDSVKFAVGQAGDTDKDSFSAGKKFALSLLEQGDGYKGVIAIPDGLAGNGAEIIRGAQEALGKNILLAGGSAGDDFKSKITYQFLNDKVLSKSVVGCGFKGDLKIGIGVKHGWIPVGVSSEVTKAEGNILYELDNKPALEIYSKYMGDIVTEKLKSNPLIAIAEGATHPLGIDMGEDKYLIRQPFFAKADGSLTLAAEVPEGKRMYLMIGDFDSVIDSAKQAAEDAMAQLNNEKPGVVLVFSCGARSIIMGSKATEQIKAIKNIIGEDVPMAGFVCYGEIAPIITNNKDINLESYFHNDTVVVMALK